MTLGCQMILERNMLMGQSDINIDGVLRLHYELARSTKSHCSFKAGNQMINANDAMHFHVKKEIVAYLRDLSHITATNYIGVLNEQECLYSKEHPCHIIVQISPPSNRRMDAPNWYPTVKALMDGLTDAGVFKDDNDKVITSFTFIPGTKTDNGLYHIDLEVRPGRFL